MALLTRQQIESADDLQTQDVDVPEWGGTVRIRPLTGRERDRLESSLMGTNGKVSTSKLALFRARVAAMCMIDEDGERLFGDADVEVLGAKSAAALHRVAEAAQKLSGLSKEDVEDLTGE
ncbi:hypothetical protein ACL02T_32920 [Pseudonocardia sp. RS010]|uniref:hypothetical protein n=1 Tax=Pseudonocardia sp. RS010 TaxID=3385979 RepID=UPI0039A07D6D